MDGFLRRRVELFEVATGVLAGFGAGFGAGFTAVFPCGVGLTTVAFTCALADARPVLRDVAGAAGISASSGVTCSAVSSTAEEAPSTSDLVSELNDSASEMNDSTLGTPW